MRGFPGFSGFPPSPETNHFTLSLSDMGRMMAFSVAIANYRLGHVLAAPFVIQHNVTKLQAKLLPPHTFTALLTIMTLLFLDIIILSNVLWREILCKTLYHFLKVMWITQSRTFSKWWGRQTVHCKMMWEKPSFFVSNLRKSSLKSFYMNLYQLR